MRTSSLRCVLALPCPHIWMVQIVVYAKRYAVPAITVCADDASRATWAAHQLSRELRGPQRLRCGLVHVHPWGMFSDRTNLF